MSDPHALPRDHNGPPENILLAELEEANAKLLNDRMMHELAVSKLPQQPSSDDDVALITAWVVKAKTLANEFEKARETAKAEVLQKGRTIDGFFGGARDELKSRAKSIEARNGPYLTAKREREEAAAKARAEAARLAAEKAEREAREAREREEAAARAVQEQAERLQRAEAERVAREEAARAQAEADEEGDDAPAVDDTSAAEEAENAEAELRARAREAQEAAEAAKRSEQAQADAEKAAYAQTKASEGGHRLSRTAGGGGAATAEVVMRASVTSWPLLLQSMGPLGQCLNETIIRGALEKAAKWTPPPTLPGVVWTSETIVKTRATRAKG